MVQNLLYGVIGQPITHSLSPLMHNAAFAAVGQKAHFTAFAVDDLASAITGIRALGVAGVSVTLPHKTEVLKYLDWISPEALEIAAVNTIVNRQGQLCGYNTDVAGALNALVKKVDPAGKRVLIIGAGGAARALVYGAVKAGAEVVITNRSSERGLRLAKEFGAKFLTPFDLVEFSPEVLVNTTSLGMTPQVDALPIAENYLNSSMVVMDIVYNPLKTRLLAAAEKCGALTVDGLEMFVGQGVMQFELWTGKKAPFKIMRAAVLEELLQKQVQ
jgi:shikimate dehydrogenase